MLHNVSAAHPLLTKGAEGEVFPFTRSHKIQLGKRVTGLSLLTYAYPIHLYWFKSLKGYWSTQVFYFLSDAFHLIIEMGLRKCGQETMVFTREWKGPYLLITHIFHLSALHSGQFLQICLQIANSFFSHFYFGNLTRPLSVFSASVLYCIWCYKKTSKSCYNSDSWQTIASFVIQMSNMYFSILLTLCHFEVYYFGS